MQRFIRSLAAAAAAVLAAGVFADSANAQGRVRAGVLDCDVSGGLGLIIGSRKVMACTFTPAQPGPREAYEGTISKFGLDIGATAGGRMVWAVYSATNAPSAALAGTYVGASADASIGAGLGANVLVGGSNRTIALQPISVQGQTGLNFAVGVTGLSLRPVR
jgi:hypothetical protein